MSGFGLAALGLFAAAAPFGAIPAFAALTAEAAPRRRATLLLAAGVAAFALLAASALLSGPFLDWISVSPENFQPAAGLVMLPPAFRLVVWGRSLTPPKNGASRLAWRLPMAAPLIAGPASLAGAMSYGARFGEGTAIAAAALAVVASSALLAAGPRLSRALHPAGVSALARLSGALLATLAVELILDSVHSV